MQVARLGAFDLVFCRNALIYFGQESKAGVLDRLARQIEPDGYLVLGAAETVVGLTGGSGRIRIIAARLILNQCFSSKC